jgi:hypothetical protein
MSVLFLFACGDSQMFRKTSCRADGAIDITPRVTAV